MEYLSNDNRDNHKPRGRQHQAGQIEKARVKLTSFSIKLNVCATKEQTFSQKIKPCSWHIVRFMPGIMVPACVLIVDDNPDVLTVLRALLELKGFEVMTSEDGEEAWRFLQQTRPDVIVTDMCMPRVDGSELIRWVQNSPDFSGIPIVAMTAYGRYDLAEVKVPGTVALLRKPTDFSRLADTLHQVLAARATPPSAE